MKKLFFILFFCIISFFQSNLIFASRVENTKNSEKILLEKAKKGDLKAQSELGSLYISQEKYDLAEKYLKLASDQGHIVAQNNLGFLYSLQGKYDLVEKYWKLASDQGDVAARNNLGFFYQKQGKYDLAEKYLKLASDQGDVDAQNNLGSLYQIQGKYDLAEKYLKLASDQGHIVAQTNLGFFYSSQKKYNLAKKYLKLASDQGHIEADKLLLFLISSDYNCAGNLEEDINIYSFICDKMELLSEKAKTLEKLGYRQDSIEQYKLLIQENSFSEKIIAHMLLEHNNQLSVEGEKSLRNQLHYSQSAKEMYQSIVNIKK